MRIDKLGRKRKKLVEKTTSLMIRLDNKTIFDLLDKFDIDYDPDAEILNKETVNELIAKLKEKLREL